MRIFQKATLTLAALLFCISLSAQFALRKANKQYELNAFNLAIQSYLDYLDKTPNNPEAMVKLADSYRHLNQMQQAAEWYDRAMTIGTSDPIHILNYGHTLMGLGQYSKAKTQYLRYAQNFPEIGNHFAKSANFAQSQINQPSVYTINNEFINTSASEFGPAAYGSIVVFNSTRTDIQRGNSNTWTGKAQNQLYAAERGSNGYLQNPIFLKNKLKNNYNEGPASFSSNGKWVAYTKNNFVDGTRHIASSGMEMSIYIAEIKANGDWVNEKPFPYNGTEYQTGFPSLNADGTKLYFASNRPDGFGGYDIFLSKRIGETWSTPENLGATVNSLGNEVTPYFDGRTLYFSSDWHQGYGGYDIFRAESENDNWVRIFHQGNGVNSPGDDYGYIYDNQRNLGYFTSNRPGGKGLEDIYKVTKTTGGIIVRVKDATSRSPIASAEVDFSSCNEGRYFTDANGMYSFQAYDGLNCQVVIRKSGYLSTIVRISTIGQTTQRDFEVLMAKAGENYAGKLIDSRSRLPMDNVNVRATNTATNNVLEDNSDYNGNYNLALAPNSTYVVRYSKSGYFDLNRTVRTTSGTDRSILGTLPLQPSDSQVGTNYPSTGGSTGTTYPNTNTGTTYPNTNTGTTTTTNTGGGTTTNIPFDTGYAVQVAAVRRLDMSTYTNLQTQGNVYFQKIGAVHKIRVGVFPDRASAQRALQVAKSKGYSGAFVVSEQVRNVGDKVLLGNGNVSTGTVNTTSSNTGTSTSTTTSSGNYSSAGFKVRLATYRDPANFDETTVMSLGVIETRLKGPWTIKLLGGFRTLSEAKSAQYQARQKGYAGAYIVVDDAGELRKVD